MTDPYEDPSSLHIQIFNRIFYYDAKQLNKVEPWLRLQYSNIHWKAALFIKTRKLQAISEQYHKRLS